MPSFAKKLLPYLMVGLLSAWIASLATHVGDWDSDAAPAVHALATGDVGSYLSAKAMMGPFATLVQAPFVALSGATGVTAYQWAVFPCLLAAGLLGLYLARIASRQGAGPITQVLLAALCLLNPLTFEALENGHPEEILTAALVVAAIAAAGEKKPMRTSVLLGLAVASKQWAVIAILPALMVLPAPRVRVAAGAVAVAALLTLPSLAASPGSFADVQTQAAGTGRVVTPWSAWYPFASPRTAVYEVDGQHLVAHLEDAPSPADPVSHPLIVLLALTLPFAVAWRRGLPLSPADGFALLALLALLRCALDPVDNLYYHEPLLLALIGWDAYASRGLPLRAVLGVGVSLVFWRALHDLSDPAAFNLAYLGFVAALGIALLSSLFKPISGQSFQFGQFSRYGAQISGIKELQRRSM
jgi:glycosyl transferase family 87